MGLAGLVEGIVFVDTIDDCVLNDKTSSAAKAAWSKGRHKNELATRPPRSRFSGALAISRATVTRGYVGNLNPQTPAKQIITAIARTVEHQDIITIQRRIWLLYWNLSPRFRPVSVSENVMIRKRKT